MVVSSESTDSMSTCRCAPRSRARRSSGRIRSAASSRPSSGACGRISGVSAVTLTERLTRGTGPAESRSSHGRSGHLAAAAARVVERLEAARRVAIGLRRGHRRLAEQVDRGSRSRRPTGPTSVGSACARRLADDEAVGHVADAGRGRARRAPCARRRSPAIFIAASSERRAVGDLVEVGRPGGR